MSNEPTPEFLEAYNNDVDRIGRKILDAISNERASTTLDAILKTILVILDQIDDPAVQDQSILMFHNGLTLGMKAFREQESTSEE